MGASDGDLRWIHPSTRDMVIQHLMRSRSDRRAFLERCGVAGLALALSTGGGADGLRKLPLMVDDDDWEVVTRRVVALMETGSAEERETIVSTLESLVASEAAEEAAGSLEAVVDLLGVALDVVRRTWDASDAPVGLSSLRSYYDASLHLDPLPGSPKLQPTWDRVIEVQREAVAEGSLDSLADAVETWTDAIDILEACEPRWLRRAGYPKALEPLAEEVITGLQAMAEGIEVLDAEEDDEEEGAPIEPSLEEQAEERAIDRLLDTLRAFFDPFGIDSEALVRLLATRSDEREERRARWEYRYEEEEPDDWNPREEGEGTFISLSSVFHDL